MFFFQCRFGSLFFCPALLLFFLLLLWVVSSSFFRSYSGLRPSKRAAIRQRERGGRKKLKSRAETCRYSTRAKMQETKTRRRRGREEDGFEKKDLFSYSLWSGSLLNPHYIDSQASGRNFRCLKIRKPKRVSVYEMYSINCDFRCVGLICVWFLAKIGEYGEILLDVFSLFFSRSDKPLGPTLSRKRRSMKARSRRSWEWKGGRWGEEGKKARRLSKAPRKLPTNQSSFAHV